MARRHRIYRATVRILDADEVALNEVMSAFPRLRTVTAAMRFALRITRWYLRLRADGGVIRIHYPDGRVVENNMDL
jgi:hypothetical protein